MKILGSASKIVFILLTITACAAFILNLLPVDQFMLLAISAFSFYFAKPASVPENTTSTVVTGDVPMEK